MKSFHVRVALKAGIAGTPAPVAGQAYLRGAHRAAAWLVAAWRAPRSPQAIVVILSVWLVGAGNTALWRALAALPGGDSVVAQAAALASLALGLTVLMLAPTAWTRGMKPVWLGVLVLAGVVQHYMLAFGIVMDASMVGNVVQTDLREARDVVGWGLAGNIALMAGLPAAWLVPLRIPPQRASRQILRNGMLFLLALAFTAAIAAAGYRLLAPLLRNQTEMKYMVNPVSTTGALANYFFKPLFKRKKGLVPVSAGAALGTSYAMQKRPPLLVLVVGETARGDHFGLNGYRKNTTPQLARQDVTSFSNVRSCGTNTLASVPCMFSPLGKQGFEARKLEHENLLDVLQAAGLAVLWLDNQSGCKGVCARVPDAQAFDTLSTEAKQKLCDGEECLDEAMLEGLDARLAALDPARRARGVVIVMHQMGSHGPAYYKRSSPAAKLFAPECATSAIADCPLADVVNAYDNSIAETDRFLGLTIDWLKARKGDWDASMLYMSDHGESLGEYGLFLHGLPYAFAPEAQKHVAFIGWFSAAMTQRTGLDRPCLDAKRGDALTHDNLYHSVLGWLDVRTPSYQATSDVTAGCRKTAAAGFPPARE